MNADTRTVVLAGTYTLDPFVPVLDHWAQMLRLPLQVRPPIYGRLHQQLLDPHSDLRQNRDGLNLIALRWEDLSGPAAGNAGVERAASEVCDFLGALDTSVPCLLIVGPSQVTRPEFTVATQALCERLQEMPHLTVLTGESIMERYRVQQTFDPAAERLGHVPYTAEAFAALGTAASRWAHSLLRMPVKVVAVMPTTRCGRVLSGKTGFTALPSRRTTCDCSACWWTRATLAAFFACCPRTIWAT